MAAFLSRCYYSSGEYGDVDSYLDLYVKMHRLEGDAEVNRLFYLAIPPSVFSAACRGLGNSGMVRCGSRSPWSRVVVEKPYHVLDIHATILHLMGLNHLRVNYLHNGRLERPTVNDGKLIEEALA